MNLLGGRFRGGAGRDREAANRREDMSTNRNNLTLSEYVARRNGAALGARGSLTKMLYRSLGADTFRGFWRYWNPIWGYYLGRYVNAPLRRVMPAAPALIATFVVSGAIHDAAILAVTGSPTFLFVPWFTVLGLMVVVSSRLGLRYRFQAWLVRAAINVSLVAGALGIVTIGERILGL
jgi:hypothetical protein